MAAGANYVVFKVLAVESVVPELKVEPIGPILIFEKMTWGNGPSGSRGGT